MTATEAYALATGEFTPEELRAVVDKCLERVKEAVGKKRLWTWVTIPDSMGWQIAVTRELHQLGYRAWVCPPVTPPLPTIYVNWNITNA